MKRVTRFSDFTERIKESEDLPVTTGLTKEQIDFLNEYCSPRNAWSYDEKTGLVDIKGDFLADDQGLSDLCEINFGKVVGKFLISRNRLESLKGCPSEVNGLFSCTGNKNLKSLEHGPKYTEGYYCRDCALESLEGSPNIVKGKFDFSNNFIESLVGSPEKVGSFVGRLNSLEDLKGLPGVIEGNIDLSQNNIGSLAGCVQKIYGEFIMDNNNLISLEGGPKEIGESSKYSVYSNSDLKSLKGCPAEVGEFDASSCSLESLEGGPKIVNGDFRVGENKLNSLVGSPEVVRGKFICEYNDIKDLKGISLKLYGNLDLEGNPIESLEGFDYKNAGFVGPNNIWFDDDMDESEKSFLLQIHRYCDQAGANWEDGLMYLWDRMETEDRVRIYKRIKHLLSDEDVADYKALEKYFNIKNLL